MNLGDSWGKLLGVAGTGALAVAAYFSNPYAPFRPMPEMCPSQATCVIVAGLDGDVNLGVGAGGQPIGFDLDDEVRRQLVDWLENAPGDLRVYKMPEEIAMPERGVSSFERNAGSVMARAAHRRTIRGAACRHRRGQQRERLARLCRSERHRGRIEPGRLRIAEHRRTQQFPERLLFRPCRSAQTSASAHSDRGAPPSDDATRGR